MATGAKILFIGGSDMETRIRDALDGWDINLVSESDPETAMANAKSNRFDFAIAEIGYQTVTTELVDELSLVGADPEQRRGALPVIAVGATASRDLGRSFVEFITSDFDAKALALQVQALSRLATLEEEFEQRALTASKRGETVDLTVNLPDRISSEPVLLVSADASQDSLVEEALGGLAKFSHCRDPFEATNMLQSGAYHALVVVVPQNSTGNGEMWLCTDCRDNVRLYNLPIIMIAEEADILSHSEGYGAGANAVLSRSAVSDNIATHFIQLMRRQLYRVALLRACTSFNTGANQDALTNLFNEDFLAQHLESEISFASRANKHLSLAHLTFDLQDTDLATSGRDKEGNDPRDRYTRQIGYVLGRLIRGEDLAARIEPDEFLLVMPATSPSTAARVVRRIAAVINTTEFEMSAQEDVIPQRVQASVAGYSEGQSPAELIAQARKAPPV